MGVRGLMKWVRTQHPECVSFHSTLGEVFGEIDREVGCESGVGDDCESIRVLCIDGNVMLHEIAGDFFGYGRPMYNGLMRMKYLRHQDKSEEAFFRVFTKEVLSMMESSGCYLLFFALDGMVPLAKMRTQRQRRFTSAANDEKEKENTAFDPLSITYGTKFMRRINDYLAEHLVSDEGVVIFSGVDEPGEGEHKLVNFLAGVGEKGKRETSDIDAYIYSVDGDVIFLSTMLECRPKIVRISYSKPGCYALVDSEKLCSGILERYTHKDKVIDVPRFPNVLTGRLNRLILLDVMLLGFLIGNDFIPAVHCSGGSPETFFESVLICYSTFGVFLTVISNGKTTINWDNFNRFVKERILCMESALIGLLGNVSERLTPGTICIPDREFVVEYYHRAGVVQHPVVLWPFDGAVTNRLALTTIQQHLMCIDYRGAMTWTLQYYSRYMFGRETDINLNSNAMVYTYDHAPLLADLVSFPLKHPDVLTFNPPTCPQKREILSLSIMMPMQKYHLTNYGPKLRMFCNGGPLFSSTDSLQPQPDCYVKFATKISEHL